MIVVGEVDLCFIGEVKLLGSIVECCKVREFDEFDFMLYLLILVENFVFVYFLDDLVGYCKVELKKDRNSEKVKDLLKDGKYLFF